MTFEEILKKDNKLVYTNVGISMLPWIREGKDLVIIESLKDKPHKYDAVLFRRNNVEGRGHYVLHRVMKVLPNDEYYIIGDNMVSGEIVRLEDILGILTSIKRQEGNIINTKDPEYIKKVKNWYTFAWPIRTAYRRIRHLGAKVLMYDKWKHLIGK